MEKEGPEASMLPSGKPPPQTSEGAKTPQYLITLAATMAAFAGGNVIGWSAPALPYLEAPDSPLPVTSHESSWIGSLLAIGAFIGALPAGPVADYFGRKITVISLAAPILISWIMIYFASSVYIIYIARLIGGFGIGAICTTVPMYVSEIAEASIRGTLCSAFQLMLVCGILYTYILGAIVSYNLLPIVCGIIPLIFIAAFFKAPETPAYLLKKDQRQRAENALVTLRGTQYNVFKELHALENDLNQDTGSKPSFVKAAMKRASLLALVICLGLMLFQQLSGINIVIFYTGNIFKDAGSTLDPALATIFVGLAQVVSTVVSGILIDKAGRKILLQVSASIMCICLLVLGWYFHIKEKGGDTASISLLPLLSVVLYILVFAIGFGPIPWMMTGEILPSEIKGVATGIAVALNWCLAFTVTKSFSTLIETMGAAKTYWLFGFICLIGFLFSTFVVIETKGKSLAEIQNELSGKKSDEQRRNQMI
ncbi:hypothetical protein O3M35_012682 [Rhynocoris fuscipes]